MSLLTSAATFVVERTQRLQHVRVVTERQRRMQSADDVQFRDAELQRFARFLDHLRNGQLETIRITFLARERTELAAQDAVVRVVEVAIDDIAGAIADFLLAREIGNGDWEVIFTPADQQPDPVAPEPAPAVDRTPASETWPTPVVELDNRDLEPPEPLVRTLEGVEALSPGQTLVALLPREPIFLLEELQARGHLWRGALEPDGHYRVVIRRG